MLTLLLRSFCMMTNNISRSGNHKALAKCSDAPLLKRKFKLGERYMLTCFIEETETLLHCVTRTKQLPYNSVALEGLAKIRK